MEKSKKIVGLDGEKRPRRVHRLTHCPLGMSKEERVVCYCTERVATLLLENDLVSPDCPERVALPVSRDTTCSDCCALTSAGTPFLFKTVV